MRFAQGRCVNGSHAVASGCVLPESALHAGVPMLHDTRPRDRPTDSHSWSLHVGSAVLSSGWVLLGEPDKWVSTSATRFSHVTDDSGSGGGSGGDALTVRVACIAGESLTLIALKPRENAQAAAAAGGSKEWVVREMKVVCGGLGGATVTFH